MKYLSYRELSALGSAAAIAVVAWLYFPDALFLASHDWRGTLRADELPKFFLFAIGLLIVLEIIYHAILAGMRPDEANEPMDERDKLIELRATSIAYTVLVAGLFMLAVLVYLADVSPVKAAQQVMLVLFIGEFVRYTTRFILYRLGI